MHGLATHRLDARHLRGRPRIDGSRIRVQHVATLHEAHGMSPDEILRAHPHLSLAEVHTALAYYYAHQDEIRRHLKEDEAFADQMRSAMSAHATRGGRGSPHPPSSR